MLALTTRHLPTSMERSPGMANRLTHRRTVRAKAQRRYAAKLKKEGAPSSDQIARAVFAAMREHVNRNSFPSAQRQEIAKPVIPFAVPHPAARAFPRKPPPARAVSP